MDPLTISALIAAAGLGYSVYSGERARGEQENQQTEAKKLRIGNLQNQIESLNQLKGPHLTPQNEARIKALEEEAKPVPLAANPQFQAERARLINSGARELAGVANQQRAQGISQGGFRNVGSLQDVQDRLGVAMASLGQKAVEEQQRKRDLAAELRQKQEDAAIAFDNARQQAYQNFLTGDTQSALAALQQASAANQAYNQSQAALGGQVLGIGSTLAGNYLQQQQQKEIARQQQEAQQQQNQILQQLLLRQSNSGLINSLRND